MVQASDTFWSIYKLFHDPPGTPKELKCVTCKVAVGVASIGVTAANLYMVKRNIITNVNRASVFGLIAFCSASAAAVALRMASDHREYNNQLIAKMKKRREDQKQQAL